MLPAEQFKAIVASSPLVSIDLVVRNQTGQVLLGKRTNRPAQGYWFVPGGRILKDEPFQQAYRRLLEVEIGFDASGASSRFLGIYQHFYDDNFSGCDFSTHYVVLAYELQLAQPLTHLPKAQHSDYRWLTIDTLLADPQVHTHSKWYFQPDKQADSAVNSHTQK